MNFTCDQCQRRYAIPDERIRGKTLQVRCKNCQHIVVLTWKPPPGREEGEEPTRAVPLAELLALQGISKAGGAWEGEPTKAGGGPDPGPWFVLVHGSQQGPVSVKDLTNRIRKGQISTRTYVWRQGMKDWLRAADVAELIPLFSPAEAGKAVSPPRSGSGLRESRRKGVPPAPTSPRKGGMQPEGAALDAGSADLGASVPWNDGSKSPQRTSQPKARLPTPQTPPPLASPAPGPAAPRKASPPARLPPPEQPELTEEALLPEIPNEDPFAALGFDETEHEAPGEATAFFIAQAGVHKRNPPWKIAAAVVGLIGLPVLVLFLLSRLHVVPLEVTRVDSNGREVKQSVFSAQGVAGLKDLLLGKKPTPPEKRAAPPKSVTNAPPRATPPPPDLPPKPPSPDLQSLYADPQKKDIGPPIARSEGAGKSGSDASGGPEGAEVKKVVEQTQRAFQFCIEQHVRKHPRFKGGKVNLVATVGPSGVVKKASLDRRDIEGSDLGICLRAQAKRMVFSSFPGDEVDLQIPLILTTTL